MATLINGHTGRGAEVAWFPESSGGEGGGGGVDVLTRMARAVWPTTCRILVAPGPAATTTRRHAATWVPATSDAGVALIAAARCGGDGGAPVVALCYDEALLRGGEGRGVAVASPAQPQLLPQPPTVVPAHTGSNPSSLANAAHCHAADLSLLATSVEAFAQVVGRDAGEARRGEGRAATAAGAGLARLTLPPPADHRHGTHGVTTTTALAAHAAHRRDSLAAALRSAVAALDAATGAVDAEAAAAAAGAVGSLRRLAEEVRGLGARISGIRLGGAASEGERGDPAGTAAMWYAQAVGGARAGCALAHDCLRRLAAASAGVTAAVAASVRARGEAGGFAEAVRTAAALSSDATRLQVVAAAEGLRRAAWEAAYLCRASAVVAELAAAVDAENAERDAFAHALATALPRRSMDGAMAARVPAPRLDAPASTVAAGAGGVVHPPSTGSAVAALPWVGSAARDATELRAALAASACENARLVAELARLASVAVVPADTARRYRLLACLADEAEGGRGGGGWEGGGGDGSRSILVDDGALVTPPGEASVLADVTARLLELAEACDEAEELLAGAEGGGSSGSDDGSSGVDEEDAAAVADVPHTPPHPDDYTATTTTTYPRLPLAELLAALAGPRADRAASGVQGALAALRATPHLADALTRATPSDGRELAAVLSRVVGQRGRVNRALEAALRDRAPVRHAPAVGDCAVFVSCEALGRCEGRLLAGIDAGGPLTVTTGLHVVRREAAAVAGGGGGTPPGSPAAPAPLLPRTVGAFVPLHTITRRPWPIGAEPSATSRLRPAPAPTLGQPSAGPAAAPPPAHVELLHPASLAGLPLPLPIVVVGRVVELPPTTVGPAGDAQFQLSGGRMGARDVVQTYMVEVTSPPVPPAPCSAGRPGVA